MDKVNTNTDLEEVQAEASAVSAPVQHSARGGVQCTWRCAVHVEVCSARGGVQCTWRCAVHVEVCSACGGVLREWVCADCEVVLGGVGWGCTVV